jgi:hypothetical protein
VVAALAGKVLARQATEFVVHERDQVPAGGCISLAPPNEQVGDRLG